jgi:tRNA(Arg) A34 adenosine deaminase TadA
MTAISINSEFELSDITAIGNAVSAAQSDALRCGQIPIVGALVKVVEPGIGKLLAIGSNRLADGLYGVHGEQGPFLTLGRRLGEEAKDCIVYSSLHPCQYCQHQLFHAGIKTVHALDIANWAPTDTRYDELGIKFITHSHHGCEGVFKPWINNPEFAKGIWLEDIGIVPGQDFEPIKCDTALVRRFSDNALRLAEIGYNFGEAPIGALLIDHNGEIISESRGRIVTDNESTMVPAMAAWRGLRRVAGSPRSWNGTTIFLTAGPDAIVEGMVRGFNFGQVVVMSSRVYAGRYKSLKQKLGERLVILDDSRGDRLLAEWIGANNNNYLLKEYLGANY